MEQVFDTQGFLKIIFFLNQPKYDYVSSLSLLQTSQASCSKPLLHLSLPGIINSRNCVPVVTSLQRVENLFNIFYQFLIRMKLDIEYISNKIILQSIKDVFLVANNLIIEVKSHGTISNSKTLSEFWETILALNMNKINSQQGSSEKHLWWCGFLSTLCYSP